MVHNLNLSLDLSEIEFFMLILSLQVCPLMYLKKNSFQLDYLLESLPKVESLDSILVVLTI